MGRISQAFEKVSPGVNFPAVKAASIRAIPMLLSRWLPHGQQVAKEWIATNPTRADTRPGSFKINIITGVWADFASGATGGDMIDLHQYLFGGDALSSAKEIGDILGVPLMWTVAQFHTVARGPVGSSALRVRELMAPEVSQRDPDTLPPRTPPDQDKKPRFIVAGDEGPPVYPDEKRRHYYKAGATPIKIKVMRKNGDAVIWYRVSDNGVMGWQSRKPTGFRGVPFIGHTDPFDPERADEPVYWPEGEKDADSVTAKGVLALTFGGVGDGLPNDCEDYLRGRQVIILADNDAPGRKHAEEKAALAFPVAASVRVIHFTEVPHKGDVSDYFQLGRTLQDLQQIVAFSHPYAPGAAPLLKAAAEASQQTAPRPRSLKIVSAAELYGQPIPPRMWHVPDVMPGRNVTLLQGDGATGKSLLALMLAASTVLGTPWIGIEDIERGPAVYLSAEDELPELHRRLDSIVQEVGVTLHELANLHLIPLAGEDAILAAPVNRSNVIEATVLWGTIERVVAEIRPRLVVLDTLADLFAGEENQRAQARQFITMLRGLALKHSTCVLLLGHPSLEGLKSGSGTSGSTGWNNSVRSRLYFQRVFTTEGSKTIEADEDVRDLTVMKANYGRKGEPIRLKWVSGVFERQSGGSFGLSTLQRDAVAEEAFLSLLGLHERLGLPVSPNASSLYAPSVFAAHSQAGGVTKRAFKGAMERLLERGKVRVVHEGPPSKRRVRITIYGEETA